MAYAGSGGGAGGKFPYADADCFLEAVLVGGLDAHVVIAGLGYGLVEACATTWLGSGSTIGSARCSLSAGSLWGGD